MARVLFLQDVLYEAFGPEVLSSVLKQEGHDCDMLVVASEGRRNLMRELRRIDPDILAFSISSFGFRWSVDLAREVKTELNVLTVFGGAHPTFFPDFAHEEGVDYACIGEGERAILDLARAIGNGHSPDEVANLARRDGAGGLIRNPLEPLVEDLDSLPFPDREIYFKYAPLRKLGFKRFMVGRGCPYGCTYCTNRVQQEMYSGLGRYVRHREPEKVVEEILEVRSRYGIKTVGFSDDTFTTNKRWTMRFLELYRREVALPFTCLTRINEIDEEIVEAMAGAGCHFVSFGLEAGSEHIRRQVLNRRMSDDQIRTGARLLHDAGIPFLTYNMFGLPGETAEDGLRTVTLNMEIETDVLGTTVFAPLLGTESYEFCKSKGFLDDTYDIEAFDRTTDSSALKNMPDLPFLSNLQKIAFIAVKYPKTLPLVTRLARLPLGPLYKLAYKVSLFFRHKLRYRLSTMELIRLGLGSKGAFG